MVSTPSSPRVTTRLGEPISPHTFRQAHANQLIFNRIREEGIDINGNDALIDAVWWPSPQIVDR